MSFSKHAMRRMQQRGISRDVVDYVLAYGQVSHDHHGGCVMWMDRRARTRLSQDEGDDVLRKIDKYLNTYVVTSTSGHVMTVGHRYRRIIRH